MKAVLSRNTAMSDVFRAFAGAPEAQFDMLANSVYTAVFHLMHSGNKTQFAKLDADARMYSGDDAATTKLIKEAVGAVRATPAVALFRRTYFAVRIALDQCGMPELVKGLPEGKTKEAEAARHAVLDPLASDYADMFVSIFTATMAIPKKTDEERAADADKRAALKAEKEKLAAKQQAEADASLAASIRAEASRMVNGAALASVPTLAEQVAAVLAALQSGMLDAETEKAIIAAANMRETAMLLALSASPATEAEPIAA